MHNYDDLDKQQLIDILRRRDELADYGLVWERERIEPDRSTNEDFVALTLDPALSCGAAPWPHAIIEGDNFDALRALATTHAGQVKLIYIDPPYNTGRRDFVYNDRFFDATHRYRHSTWLEFMYPRLQLARQLLAEDGAIFVSIDDNELFNLGLLMNKVFGGNKHVATCIWQKRYSRENREAIGDAHEYLLVYSPNPDKFKQRRGLIPLSAEQSKVYRNPDNPDETDPAKRWQSISLTAQGFRPNQMYEIRAPNGRVHRPPEGRCWALIESELEKLRAKGRITFGKDGNGVPRVIRFLSDVEGVVPWTWWPHEEVGHTDEARKEIQSMFGSQTTFDTPKPVRLLERVLKIGAPEKDSLVLDFFAGSGTFAQAVLKMNAEDGGARRFILVSNREATDDAPDKNLCRDVCAERVRRAAQGYTNREGKAVAGLGGGFAYLRAERVPMHRLDALLADGSIWQHALLQHGHPLTPFTGPLAVSHGSKETLCYCANTHQPTLAALREAVQASTAPVVVFAWNEAALAEALAGLEDRVRAVIVPEALRRRFRTAHATLAAAPNVAPESA